jgi:hypothetical protein
MITLSIDLLRLDRSRIREVIRNDGSKAKYLDLALFENRDGRDERGQDGRVKQQITKEERLAGKDKTMPILGNFKNWSIRDADRPKQKPQNEQVASSEDEPLW